jgi:hypothetical protein
LRLQNSTWDPNEALAYAKANWGLKPGWTVVS